MSKELASNANEIRSLASSLFKLAMEVDAPPLDTSKVANEEELAARIDNWTKRARQAVNIAKALTVSMGKFAGVETLIDKENEKLELFSEAEALLKKRKDEERKETLMRNAYDVSRIAEAVKRGFKVSK